MLKKLYLQITFVFAMSMLFVSQSFAALPAAVGTAFTSLETDIASLEGLIWSVVILITFALILIRVFKRFANKA